MKKKNTRTPRLTHDDAIQVLRKLRPGVSIFVHVVRIYYEHLGEVSTKWEITVLDGPSGKGCAVLSRCSLQDAIDAAILALSSGE